MIGVPLGGALTHALGWEAVFFVTVPLVGIALVFAFALVPFALVPTDRERELGSRFDLPGALSATLGVTLLVFALVQGPRSPGILASAAGGSLALAAFAVIEGCDVVRRHSEARVDHPALDA